MTSFSSLDWIVVACFLFASLVIGVLARQRVRGLDDFLVAGRRLRSFWGVATLASTEMGLVTIIYFSEEAYLNGFVAIVAGVIAGLTMWAVGRSGFIVGRLRSLELRTVPEYFAVRFRPGVRWIAGVLTFLTGILNLGIFLQVEGRFLVIVTGLPEETLPLIMAVLLVFVVSYTMLGGMYSVVITDVFQFLLILGGIGITSWFAFSHAGGIGGMAGAVSSRLGSAGFNLWEAPKYGLLFLLWTALYYTSGWTGWQPVVQRTLSMKDSATALKLYRISSFFMFFRACMPMLWGIAALAVLGVVDDSQTALPRMLASVIPDGLIGFTLLGFLAASMSTYDSYLLSFGSIFVQDIWAPLQGREISGRERMRYIRAAILVIALVIYLWGMFFTFTDTVFRLIVLTGSLSYAGILCGLVGGLYWKRATTEGAYFAFAASSAPPLAALIWPEIGTTTAGLLSFLLSPLALVAGSLLIRRGRASSF